MAKKLMVGVVLVLSLTVGSLVINAVEKQDIKITVQKKSLNEEIPYLTKGLTSRQPMVVYSTDFETAGEWTVEQLGTTGHIFQWVTDSYHSPTHSWHVPDDSAMTEANAVPIETAIESPDITLPTTIEGGPVTKILMSYWFRVNTPNTVQGGYVYDVWQPEIFVPYEGANFWHTDATEAYGGTGKSWWCGDPSIGTYRPNWRQELWTPVLDLSGASGTVTLNFKNAPNSEPGYDYCYVEISKDGGKTWDRLARYDEEHDPVQYFDASFDITAYATSTVIVRWRFTADSGTESKHSWHIDNVQIADGATTYLYDDGGDTGPVVLLPKEHPYAWQRLHYDYNPNRFMPADNWYQEDNTTIFNGTLNLLKWAGLTVKIRMRVSTDGWNRLGLASGPGFYFDDVQIVGFGKPAVDLEFLGVSNLLAAAVDKPLNAKAYIANAGRDTLSGSITWYGSIKDEDGARVATVAGRKDVTGFLPGTCLGIETTEALRWVPKEPGDYSMTAYLLFRGDEYAANDTTSVDFVVLGPPFAETVYGEDFEGGALTLADFGFTVVNKGGDAQGNNENTWGWRDPFVYGAAPIISGYYNYTNRAEKLDETLISPPIDISGVGKHNTLYLLHYIYFRAGHASLPAPWGTQFTDLTIEYTVNGGATWTRIFYWADNDTLPGDYNRWPQTRLGIPYTTKTTLDLSDAVGNKTLQLRWRVTSQNSYVFGISIDEILIYAGIGRPKITSVTDVPKDQGKQVRVSWNASFSDLTLYDESGEEHVVTHYGLWRAIPAGASGKATNSEAVKKVSNKKEMLASAADAKPGDRFILASGGGWDFIATILAHQDPSYNYVAPTLWDSVMTTFMVSAHTNNPMIFVDSKPMAGMSIDNLAPAAPANVTASSYNNVITVTWDASPDPDVQFYSVYRSKQKGVYPDKPIARTGNLFFQETPTVMGVTYYYAISATDYGWNESPKSQTASVVTSVGDEQANAVPTKFALFQNYPNPFNPVTTIKYQLPEAAHVTLKIYNIYGQEIATLVDGPKEAGYFTVEWNAKDVASGVYFYELKAGSFVKTMKMILMK